MNAADLTRCPCCEATDWVPRWGHFVVCRRCRLMRMAQPVLVDDLRTLYQADYFKGREYIDYVADKSAHQKTLARHLRVVRRHVPEGARLLEIGCAHGFFLELARPIYPGSVGVDISATAVAYARARGLDAREGDLSSQHLREQFDAVCLWDTVEHLPSPDTTLQQACALLRPGGCLFLSTGDSGALLPRLRGRRWRQIHPPTHLFYFTRPSLRALCRRLGVDLCRFGTVRVYRRLGSALKALARSRSRSFLARVAAGAERVSPAWLQRLDIPLNLGDTLCLAARKHRSLR
jgi:SAM-dependent methyltransferase